MPAGSRLSLGLLLATCLLQNIQLASALTSCQLRSTIDQNGVRCDEVDGECVCARPCSVLKTNEYHTCSSEEVRAGLCQPTGICDNTPAQAGAMRPMASGLLSEEVAGTFTVSGCLDYSCSKPGHMSETCLEKAKPVRVGPHRAARNSCNCLDHPDFGAMISGDAKATSGSSLSLSATICEHKDKMECDLAIGEGYYNGWTLFLVNSDTCTEASTNTKFEVASSTDNEVTLTGAHGFGASASLRFSLRWMPNAQNNWLNCTKGCYRAYGGTGTSKTNVFRLPSMQTPSGFSVSDVQWRVYASYEDYLAGNWLLQNWYWWDTGPSEMYLEDGHYFIAYMMWGYRDFTSRFSAFGGEIWWEYSEFSFEAYPWIYFGNAVGIASSPADKNTWFSVSGCAIEVPAWSEGPIEDWKDVDGDGCEFWDDEGKMAEFDMTCEDAYDFAIDGEDASSQCCMCSGSAMRSEWASGWRSDYDYVPLASGRYKVWYEAEGYESYWHSLSVNEYEDSGGWRYMYSSVWVEALNANELVFVMHWRYTCPGGEATCDEVQVPPYGQGADEIDTLIMPDNDDWTPVDPDSTARYAFWDSSELEKGSGAYIGFDQYSSTGGYAESTYFRNLKDTGAFDTEQFAMWVSAYSNGPFAAGQASVYIFCGQGACLDEAYGNYVEGFYYSATMGAGSDTYWWNPGHLVLQADADGAVYWEDCVENCYVGNDESPYLYWDSSMLRVMENSIVLPGIAGVGSLSVPARGDVTMFFWRWDDEAYWPGAEGQALAAAGSQSELKLPSGEWQISFQAADYYTVYVEVSLTGGQTYSIPTITFVESLLQGQVRFIMTWKYQCLDGGSTCDEAMKPYKSQSCNPAAGECEQWGADEVDTLIMPSDDSWAPTGSQSQRYAYWESPEITSGGARIAFDESTATGGYAETTLFEDLDLATNPDMSFRCWVNAYSGGALSPGQVTVYIYCGENTCEDVYGSGNVMPAGLIAQVEQPVTAGEEIYWWSAGTVWSSGTSGMVSWSSCEDGMCSVGTQSGCCWLNDLTLAPYLYGIDSNMRITESTLVWGKITGVSSSSTPEENQVNYKVEETDGLQGGVLAAADSLVGFDGAQGALWMEPEGTRVPAGTYKITYSAAGYMDYWEYVKVSGGDMKQLSDVIFAQTLQQGQVQVVLQWQFVCPVGTAEEPVMCTTDQGEEEECAAGSTKCNSPSRPFLSPGCITADCPRTGAGEVDTLIMPSTNDWTSSDPDMTSVGYAYWEDPNIESGGASIGFNENFATGGYYETTIFENLDQASTPVQNYGVWVHAYSGENGCRNFAWAGSGAGDPDGSGYCDDYSLSEGQTQILVFCGPDTCIDADGFTQEGLIGVALQPPVSGIFWWNSGHIVMDEDGKVTWSQCGGDGGGAGSGAGGSVDASCFALDDTESPYKFGSEAEERIEQFRRKLPAAAVAKVKEARGNRLGSAGGMTRHTTNRHTTKAKHTNAKLQKRLPGAKTEAKGHVPKTIKGPVPKTEATGPVIKKDAKRKDTKAPQAAKQAAQGQQHAQHKVSKGPVSKTDAKGKHTTAPQAAAQAARKVLTSKGSVPKTDAKGKHKTAPQAAAQAARKAPVTKTNAKRKDTNAPQAGKQAAHVNKVSKGPVSKTDAKNKHTTAPQGATQADKAPKGPVTKT